jgi:hypothetical protein
MTNGDTGSIQREGHSTVRHRRVVALALTLTCAVILAACYTPPTGGGGGEPTTTTEATTTVQAGAAAIVSPTTGLDADGSTLTVTGTGYTPSANPTGLYVAVGIGAGPVPTQYSNAKFVRTTGPEPETVSGAKLQADGSFAVTLTGVKPLFFGQTGDAVNCYVTACSVYVWSAHTGSYGPWSSQAAISFETLDHPVVAVSKQAHLAIADTSVKFAGAGFDPSIPNVFPPFAPGLGVYVAYGPVDPAAPGTFWLDAAAFASAKWVRPGGPSPETPTGGPMNADGTFQVNVDVPRTFTNGSGSVDCTLTPCSIVTMAAHGSPIRTQDSVSGITFAP